MDSQQLCIFCSGLNIELLTRSTGYQHVASRANLRKSAKACPMCKLLEDSLGKDKDDEEPLAEAHFTCRFPEVENSKVMLEITSSKDHGGYVRVYTAEDDPAVNANVEVKLSPLSTTADELTIPLAGGLIRTCLVNHKCGDPFRHPVVLPSTSHSGIEILDTVPVVQQSKGRSTVLDTLPTRLIDLKAFDDDSLDARLFDVPENSVEPGSQAFYTALTYCWGQSSTDMYKTTVENMQSRKDRISWKDLPPTFQDAFRITRELDIPYLWIDAICIIQDSEEDWEQESSKMGGIYASSLVTISADASSSVNSGILGHSTSESEDDRTVVRIRSVLQDGRESCLCFYNQHSTAPGTIWSPPAIVNSPLSTRSWCMQERMLSPRIMHFTQEGFIWECRDKYLSLHMMASIDYKSNSRTVAGAIRCLEEGLEDDGWGLSVPSLESFGLDATALTEEQLDLLNAVFESGRQTNWGPRQGGGGRKKGNQHEIISWWNRNVVALYSHRHITFVSDRLSAISGVANLFATYVESPYIAGLWLSEIEEGLEWRKAGQTYQNERLQGPSFSWVSYPGPVEWPSVLHMRPNGKAFDIIDHGIDLSGLDPYGKVISAELKLHGHLRAIRLGPTGPEEVMSYQNKRQLLNEAGEKVGEAEMDFNDFEDVLHCFLLYENSFGFLRLLILVERLGKATKEYHRAGIGMIRPKHALWLLQTEKQTICLS